MITDITFVHPIAGKCPDATMLDVYLPDGAAADRKAMAKALRNAGVLTSGVSVREMRVDGDKVVCFPSRVPGGWHSLTLSNIANGRCGQNF